MAKTIDYGCPVAGDTKVWGQCVVCQSYQLNQKPGMRKLWRRVSETVWSAPHV